MTAATGRRPRVLCVDDDAFMLNVLTRTIGADYEVLTSSSGAEGLQLMENSEPIQVVVSDHRMPGLSGAQFLQAGAAAHICLSRRWGPSTMVRGTRRHKWDTLEW